MRRSVESAARLVPTALAREVRAVLAAAGLLLLLPACGGEEDYGPDEPESNLPDPIDNKKPLPPATGLDCENGTYLTWGNFGEAFLRQHCATCHTRALGEGARGDAPAKANFDTHDDARLWRSLMLDKAGKDSSPMPPGGGVSPVSRAVFNEWLKCGSPG